MATFDWSIEQPNVINVPEPNMTVLTTPEDGACIVRYVNPKGIIEQRTVEHPAQRSVECSTEISEDLTYDMTVSLNDEPPVALGDTLNVHDHSIWHGAQGIASKLHTSGDDAFTLWPGNHAVESHKLTVAANEAGTLKINVKLSDGRNTSLHAVYPEMCQPAGNRQLTGDQIDFQKKFRRGDARASSMLPNIHALCGEDVSGNAVKLIWHVRDNQTAQLVDIEYPLHNISGSSYANVQKINFRCDPMDLDQVTGLVMALEDKMAAGALEGPVIQQAFDTIDTHRKALETDEAMGASPKVNAAVKEATDALWQTIDGRARERKYQDKLMRGGGEMAIKLATDLKNRMLKARLYGKDKRGPKKWISSSRKKTIRDELRDLETAINLMIRSRGGVSDDELVAYQQAKEIIGQALDPNFTSETTSM
jgi:hypothetical protein